MSIHIEVRDTSEPADHPDAIREMKEIYVTIDLPEARGEVTFHIEGYGIYISLPGFENPVALIDMFHQSEPGKESPYHAGDKPNLVIYDTVQEDSIATIRFTDIGTRIHHEYDLAKKERTVIHEHQDGSKTYENIEEYAYES